MPTRRHKNELLLAFIHGELDETRESQVRDHLQTCQTCQAEYESLSELVKRLDQKRCSPAPPEVWAGVVAQLAHIRQIRKPRPLAWAWTRRVSLTAIAATLVAGFVALWWLRSETARPPASLPLAGYLNHLEQAPSANLLEYAPEGFVPVTRDRALLVAGVAHVPKLAPVAGYALRRQLLRATPRGDVVDLIYAGERDQFAVLVAPAELDFSFGERPVRTVHLDRVTCKSVASSSLQVYWFGAGTFHCVLIAPDGDADRHAAIIRYFRDAHASLSP